VDQLDRASGALAELLAIRRMPAEEIPPGPALPILRESVARWHGVLTATGRSCTLQAPDVPSGVQVPAAVLRQVLDVLLDNSVAHGRGPVVVRARAAGAWLLVDVTDAGSIVDPAQALFARGVGRGTGLGLSLAQSLAESIGGRLVLADPTPTRFTLALPSGEDA
jgi:signal transduction histidine kinase